MTSSAASDTLRAAVTGELEILSPTTRTPLVFVKHFRADRTVELPAVASLDDLVRTLDEEIGSKNLLWAARIDGRFTRIELRSPDPMANPYLVNAVTLAAGLDGIERKLELPPEATAETLKLTDRQMVEAGYTPLPRSLKEALDVFEDSQFMKDALGEHIHSFFLKKKRDEWHKFESTITEWEIKHYLANS